MQYRLLFLLVLIPGFLHAQVQTERDVIASAGSSFSSINLQVGQTVGEPVVSDEATIHIHLSQGFQQYVQLPNSIDEQDIVDDFSLYPNPVSDDLTISFSSTERSDWQIDVTNVLGKVMAGSTESLSDRSAAKVTLDCSQYPRGVYFVRLVNQKSRQSISYKFLKIK